MCTIDGEQAHSAFHPTLIVHRTCAQIIPVDSEGALHEAFSVRLEELMVIDMQFLYGAPLPTLAVLYQDTKEARHFKTYQVVLKDKVRTSAQCSGREPSTRIQTEATLLHKLSSVVSSPSPGPGLGTDMGPVTGSNQPS